MARKKAQKAADAVAKADGEQITNLSAKVSVEVSEETPFFYVNYAEAGFAAHEIALSFVRIPTKLSSAKVDEAKGGILRCEATAHVLFAPTLLPGLIRSLTTIKESYEKTFGPVKEPGGTNDSTQRNQSRLRDSQNSG
jgi:hypothetical protein